VEVPNMFGKQKLASLVAEFLGSGVLTLVTLKVLYSLGVPFFVAMAAGLVLAMLVFVFAARSWGYFNPAITLAMVTIRRIDAITGVMYIIVQLLGAWAGYGLYTYMMNGSPSELTTSFSWQSVTVQAVGTGVFALGLAAAIYQAFSRVVTASIIGLSFMVGMLIALTISVSQLTGQGTIVSGFLNPAVSLGVRGWNIWGSLGWGVSVLGPVIGAVVGVNLYKYLFADATEVAVTSAASAAKPAVVKPASRTATAKTATKRAAAKKPAAKKRTAARKK
jgi:aquaporin rerated protein, other eukaryote